MPATGVCDPPLLALLLHLILLSPGPSHDTAAAAVVFLQSFVSSSAGSHRGSGHRRLPPFPAAGAVQQESLSLCFVGASPTRGIHRTPG
jgi:hypothetical protein